MTNAPTLTLDFKKNRIRLYKSALKTLGMPKRIQILINSADRILAVQAARNNPRDQGVSVSVNFFAGTDSCDIYSLRLLRILRLLLGLEKSDATYSVNGHYADNDTVVMFPLNDATALKENDDEQ